jgi:hypothetical protein
MQWKQTPRMRSRSVHSIWTTAKVLLTFEQQFQVRLQSSPCVCKFLGLFFTSSALTPVTSSSSSHRGFNDENEAERETHFLVQTHHSLLEGFFVRMLRNPAMKNVSGTNSSAKNFSFKSQRKVARIPSPNIKISISPLLSFWVCVCVYFVSQRLSSHENIVWCTESSALRLERQTDREIERDLSGGSSESSFLSISWFLIRPLISWHGSRQCIRLSFSCVFAWLHYSKTALF